MSRTLWRDSTTLTLAPRGNDTAIFDFAYDQARTTVRGSRIITLPVGSKGSTGLHWHEEYTEHVRVIKGRASITLDGVTKDYGPEDGIVTFPRFHIHGFGRADGGGLSGDMSAKEDLEIEEWVDPENGFKAVFFYNIFGLLLDAKGSYGPRVLLELLMVLDYVDEYPVILPGPQWLNSIMMRTIMKTSTFLGRLLGYKSWHKEYTPEHLWDVARTRGASNRMGDGIKDHSQTA